MDLFANLAVMAGNGLTAAFKFVVVNVPTTIANVGNAILSVFGK